MKQKENTTKKIEKLNVLTGLKSKILDILKKHNVIRAGIFGSFARGEQKKNSDIDILIEFEGIKSLSPVFKKKYSEIEWRKIAGTRDVLIHSYFSVDIDLLWEIVEKDLHLL